MLLYKENVFWQWENILKRTFCTEKKKQGYVHYQAVWFDLKYHDLWNLYTWFGVNTVFQPTFLAGAFSARALVDVPNWSFSAYAFSIGTSV